jgi:hypothetical protein
MADKKRNILEFVEQSNFEQFTPTPIFNTTNNENSFSQIKQNSTLKRFSEKVVRI